MRKLCPTDLKYHLQRARSERDMAYRSGNGPAADAHMRLSALHLQRALLLQTVGTRPVGNVHPLDGRPVAASSAAMPQLREPPSIRLRADSPNHDGR